MLTVTCLDRLGRTTVDTLKTVRDLDARGIRVTARDLDTATPGWRGAKSSARVRLGFTMAWPPKVR